MQERNDLLKTFVTRNQLKFALFSWYSCEDYPLNPYQFNILLLKFKDDLFKKVYNQKKQYLKSIEGVVGENKLDLTNDDALAALNPLEKEKIKQEKIRAMTKYTLIEHVSQAKSEIIVIRDEIDRLMLMCAIDIIEKEYAGLSAALDSEASQISSFIHPFQQFASV